MMDERGVHRLPFIWHSPFSSSHLSFSLTGANGPFHLSSTGRDKCGIRCTMSERAVHVRVTLSGLGWRRLGRSSIGGSFAFDSIDPLGGAVHGTRGRRRSMESVRRRCSCFEPLRRGRRCNSTGDAVRDGIGCVTASVRGCWWGRSSNRRSKSWTSRRPVRPRGSSGSRRWLRNRTGGVDAAERSARLW